MMVMMMMMMMMMVLVHHQARLHPAGLLVSVGHHATDKVGLGLVEGAHQVVELALEVGGDGLAALALLPILVLWCLDRLTRMVGKALGKELNINQSKEYHLYCQGIRPILDHLHLESHE